MKYPESKKENDSNIWSGSGQQELCLYHIPTRKKVLLGLFDAPSVYRGEWRCDLHPRLTRSATKVVIDSPHEGNGRQMYLVDIEDAITMNRV